MVGAEARGSAADRVGATISAVPASVAGAFVIVMLLYIRTLMPGVGFGDWAETQLIPAQLGEMHPTGYPLYLLLGKLFSLVPVGSVGYRATLLSAMTVAGAVAVTVAIARRLEVRPVIALGAALTLAVTGTMWDEATFPDLNGLHLLLVALLLHRSLVWRSGRRHRDLVIGALLGGLCVSNHGLAITVVPLVVLFVLVNARHEIAAHAGVLAKAAGAFILGLAPYLYLPLRAMAGPPAIYGRLLTWNGLFDLVSGAQFRSDMHFTSMESLRTAWAALPQVVDHVVSRSHPAFLVIGLVGVAILLVRDRWFGLLLAVLGAVNVFFYANYLGDLSHYLLTTWLILAIGLAVAVEAVVRLAVRRLGATAEAIQFAVLGLALALLVSNWATHDQSANHDGERFAAEVFAALPANAVLLTYWDALTTLSYEHCVEGVRPDVSLRALDEQSFVPCDPLETPLSEVALRRPVFALMVQDDSLAAQTHLTPVPVATIRLPWGRRYPDVDRNLYQLLPDGVSP